MANTETEEELTWRLLRRVPYEDAYYICHPLKQTNQYEASLYSVGWTAKELRRETHRRFMNSCKERSNGD